MFLHCDPLFPSVDCNTFYMPAKRLLPCTRALTSAYTLDSATPELQRRIITMSGNVLAQYATQSAIHANEKLVGQSGRHYLIERVLQSKQAPLSHVYLTTCVQESMLLTWADMLIIFVLAARNSISWSRPSWPTFNTTKTCNGRLALVTICVSYRTRSKIGQCSSTSISMTICSLWPRKICLCHSRSRS